MEVARNLDVHNHNMRIHTVSDEFLAAFQAACDSKNWDDVKQRLKALQAKSHGDYMVVGERVFNTDITQGQQRVTDRAFDLMSSDGIKIDPRPFSQDMDDAAANAEIERQVGHGALDRMLVVHQFRMAGQEMIAVDYLPEESRALVFYKDDVFLIAPGIGGRQEDGRSIDLVQLAGGDMEFNLYPVERGDMAHTVIHARRLEHASARLDHLAPG